MSLGGTYKPERRVAVERTQPAERREFLHRRVVRHKVHHGRKDERRIEVDEERRHLFEAVEDEAVAPRGDAKRERAMRRTVADREEELGVGKHPDEQLFEAKPKRSGQGQQGPNKAGVRMVGTGMERRETYKVGDAVLDRSGRNLRRDAVSSAKTLLSL